MVVNSVLLFAAVRRGSAWEGSGFFACSAPDGVGRQDGLGRIGTVNSYPTYASPLTITATGTVNASSGNGVYGYPSPPQLWTLANYGTVTANSANGVDLAAAGTVANSGTIEATGAHGYGVRLHLHGPSGREEMPRQGSARGCVRAPPGCSGATLAGCRQARQ